MKKTNATTSECRTSGRIAKLENKIRRAETKLANTEAKLEKRRAKLAAAREAYEAVLAASTEAEQEAATQCRAEDNGDDHADD